MHAYCSRCKALREVRDPVTSPSLKGGTVVRGTCATCGKNVGGFVRRGSPETPPPGGRG